MTNKIQHFPSRLWRLLFLALPLAACTSEVTDEDLQGDASPIAFRTAEVTKAVVTGFNDGDAFSVWGGYGGDATNVFDGVTVTNSNGSWTYSPYQYWIAGKSYRFYAVYPTAVKTEVAEDGTITVTDFDASKTGKDAVDLMTAQSGEMSGSSPELVAFTFNHALTRLSFAIKLADDMPAGYKVSVNNLSFRAYSQGNMTQSINSDASWSVVDKSLKNYEIGSETLQNHPDIIATGATNEAVNITENHDLLMIPQDMVDQVHYVHISYKLENNKPATDPAYQFLENEVDIPLTNASVTSWGAGEALAYTIIISPQHIALVLTVGDWMDGNSGYEDIDME